MVQPYPAQSTLSGISVRRMQRTSLTEERYYFEVIPDDSNDTRSMNGLQVLRHKVGIPPRHLKGTVSQDLLQMEHGSAAPQMVHRERMPETVNRSGGCHHAQPLAQQLDPA